MAKYSFSVILGIFMAFLFGFGWMVGLGLAERHATSGLGPDGVHMPTAAIIAHNVFGQGASAKAVKAAAAQHGQYTMQGLFDLAHHAF